MPHLLKIVEFHSPDFAPFLPDDAQLGHGIYGAELAYWLARALAVRGVITTYPARAAQGWTLGYMSERGSAFGAHCVNIRQSTAHWQLALLGQSRHLFSLQKPPYTDAARLVSEIKSAIAQLPSATSICWLWEQSAALAS